MLVYVHRIGEYGNATYGRLYVDGTYLCDTLEDMERMEKVYGETAIPQGQYKMSLTYSPKFKRILPLIENVPGFTGIRIHSGNTTDDTSGCILVGEYSGNGTLISGTSKPAFDRLYKMLVNSTDISIKISGYKPDTGTRRRVKKGFWLFLTLVFAFIIWIVWKTYLKK